MNEVLPEFLKNIADHKMVVMTDAPYHRHIVFKRPQSSVYRFEIVTWPGYLCICGDMGTYVFCRLEDMFQFFRPDKRDKGELPINLGYWAEKLQAADPHSGYKEFSKRLFTEVVREEYKEHIADIEGTEYAEALWEELEDEVLSHVDDGEHDAMHAAFDFRFSYSGYPDFDFQDFWEHNLREYTYHYIWICYAIVWAIKQYDRYKGGEPLIPVRDYTQVD